MRIECLRVDRRSLTLLSLVILTAWIWFLALSPREQALEATILDVGQADCIFVRTPAGRTMLVDGGGRPDIPTGDAVGLRVIAPFLRRRGVNRIDVVVLTHPHEDHIQGLVRVIKDFNVGMVLDPGLPHPSQAYTALLSEVELRGIPYHRARRGQVLHLDTGVKAQILNPPDPRLKNTEDDLNNNSVVLRLTYGKESILFCGDAGVEAEDDILAAGLPVRSTVLKVAHHGSRDASSSDWFRAVSPSIAVISVGRRNSFGHPSQDVIHRLGESGAQVYRTDRHGAVCIVVKPGDCAVYPSLDLASD